MSHPNPSDAQKNILKAPSRSNAHYTSCLWASRPFRRVWQTICRCVQNCGSSDSAPASYEWLWREEYDIHRTDRFPIHRRPRLEKRHTETWSPTFTLEQFEWCHKSIYDYDFKHSDKKEMSWIFYSIKSCFLNIQARARRFSSLGNLILCLFP